MARKPERPARPPQWHLDLRIEAELPDDNIVGRRFLIHAAATAATVGIALFTGWLAYATFSLRHQVRDWEQRIHDNQAEVREIQRLQREYAVEAGKIDQAHSLVRPQFFVSELVSSIGRTRPDLVAIDIIEWNELGVIVRGSVKDKSEPASRLVASYVEVLRADAKIAPLFREIVLTDLDRGTAGETLRFEIVFRLKGSA